MYTKTAKIPLIYNYHINFLLKKYFFAGLLDNINYNISKRKYVKIYNIKF